MWTTYVNTISSSLSQENPDSVTSESFNFERSYTSEEVKTYGDDDDDDGYAHLAIYGATLQIVLPMKLSFTTEEKMSVDATGNHLIHLFHVKLLRKK